MGRAEVLRDRSPAVRDVPVLRLLRRAALRLLRLLQGAMPMPTPYLGAVAVTTYPMPAVLHGEPISYRQMQYWITRFPDRFSESANPGRSGIARALTVHDVRVLRRMARLVDAGFQLDVAGRLPESDSGYYRLTPHVVVRVSAARR